MGLTGKQLIQKYPHLWQEATEHLFIERCKLGTIEPEQFNRWLVQDFLFVIDLMRMVARVLATAPPHHFDVILGVLIALRTELKWLGKKTADRNIKLHLKKQASCQKYCEFLFCVATKDYAVQATAFWAMQLAYNQGWQLLGKMPYPYDEFAERWGNLEFTEYVRYLESQADEALQNAPEKVQQQAEEAFLQVARLEKDFWQMAFNADE